MGTYHLIERFDLSKLNKAETISVLSAFMARLPAREAGAGLPELHISAEQLARMETLLAGMRALSFQTGALATTREMRQTDSERDRTFNYIVRRVTDYEKLPLANQRDLAQRLEPALRQYRGAAAIPHGQETEAIQSMLRLLAKPEHAGSLAALSLEEPIAQLARLNERYRQLEAQRDKERLDRQALTKMRALTAEAQELLDDLCDQANAASLILPSATADAFIRDVKELFASARTAYKRRDKRKYEKREKA